MKYLFISIGFLFTVFVVMVIIGFIINHFNVRKRSGEIKIDGHHQSKSSVSDNQKEKKSNNQEEAKDNNIKNLKIEINFIVKDDEEPKDKK